ncbi:hypothetical protein QBC35DRAFT_234148 [Podospora australis]|uniref:Uncharacterized protein n=1 Tax=Podospora australis TaxID=1536484 RepID=A0AAN7AG70_9PEZI|nr:hypothetical protein QBC35DRAFT_234148 [Podospora australis]
MNRFRTKKKAKDDLSTAARSSEDSEHSSRAFFRSKKKTQQEETKPEFDLTTALPSNDDFRTSLLMSNLSARFSMLREQDDPNSKIGKASDDSVLYPKRQSRMADFGFSSGVGLSDIAEVESIKAPFLRKDSFASDDTDSKGNVMSRSKPTEGNNLFGGRQKIYKIPAGAKSSSGGMTGRALYDDDVAMSAFQRWRAAERERSRERAEAESEQQGEDDEPARPTSSGLNAYNPKRETSSTTSSASIMARNSTAATSINSQVTGSTRESQVSTTPTSVSASSTPAAPERLVTKAKRLYEQGLTQNMQEQQSSALSRIDTLTGKRSFGTRATDPTASVPSPTTSAALDRPLTERRAMLAMASAPNLRSASPVVTSTSTSPTMGISVPAQPEAKPSFGGAPPLSPPISETGEVPILPIQPNDIGKATALGMFQKPAQPYDESRYAQRQIQLQQGRETPTQKFTTDSNDMSESQPAPLTVHDSGAKIEPIKTKGVAQDTGLPPTPIPDSAVPPSEIPSVILPSVSPEASLQRPSDEDHPAFRQSAMPTPLSVSSKLSDEPSPVSEQLSIDLGNNNPADRSPMDSPTLGGATLVPAGLSGMVRQHLRSESNASSIYDEKPQTSGFDSRLNSGAFSPSLVHDLAGRSNPWMNSGHEWAVSYYGSSADKPESQAKSQEDTPQETKPSDRTSNIPEEEEDADEFASQLADARRRVREKLTSYVESDSSRAASPQPQSERELATAASSPSLGLGILKSKSSLGSIVDRSRNVAATQSKTMKMLGVSAANVGTSPQPTKQFFDERELSTLGTMKEERTATRLAKESQSTRVSSESANDEESRSVDDKDDGVSANPGLKAFRQARRELQRRKELETLARHQASQTSYSNDQIQPPPRADRGANSRNPSGERRPPPVAYRPRAPSDESNYNNSPRPSGDRDRSGSESGARSNSRPPRIRTQDQLAPGSARPPMMRSPGLPGTDIKGSPIMPPHPYPGRGVPSPAPSPLLNQSRSVGNLALHTGRLGFDHPSGQPSPISPMGLPSPSPYAAGAPASPIGTPTSLGPRQRQSSLAHSPALGPVNSMRRPVDKREISEPTLLSSTTRVPVMNLPNQRPPMGSEAGDRGRQYPEPRSRSGSRGNGPAPPVPPINPRRRREDSRNRQLEQDDTKSAFTSEDEAARDYRRRLRKANPSAADGPVPPSPRSAGVRGRDNSPPYLAKGPPPRMNPGMGPGGMI